MELLDKESSIEIKKRKENLQQMITEFDKLKDEGKLSEAWQQLIATLKYANDTLKCSANILKRISDKMPKELSGKLDKAIECAEEDEIEDKKSIKKMIVIPKNPTIN